jgi:DNA-binding CsgD family transcriptional regulator
VLTIDQPTRNPTPQERRILTSLANGSSRAEAALAAGITVRLVTVTLEHLRDRYAPTTCSLIALAVKLEWIAVPVWMPKHNGS